MAEYKLDACTICEIVRKVMRVGSGSEYQVQFTSYIVKPGCTYFTHC